MNDLEFSIEKGDQRGVSKNLIIEGISYWSDAAIQKYNNSYVVHVSLIEEQDMTSEKYKKYFTRSYETYELAVSCIEKESEFLISDFSPIKGQLIFNPEYNEEIT